MKRIIQCKNLYKEYKNAQNIRYALNNLSLDISMGTFNIIAGPSGSGKTTLLNMIGGMDTPTKGEVKVNGKVLNDMDEKELALFRRSSVGFVFQGNNLIESLTVKENIILPLYLNKKRHKNKKVKEILQLIGLSDRENNYPNQLSAGEQQRVALARAVVYEPYIVLADEPASNLDSKTGERIMEIFKMLQQESGVTVLLATHNQKIISRFQNIIEIIDGHIL